MATLQNLPGVELTVYILACIILLCSSCTWSLTVQIDPATAYLREEFGQRAFFPDANNEFQLPSSVGATIFSLVVEGSPPNSRAANQITGSSAACIPGPSSGNRPIFSTKKEVSVKVKVVQATLKKSPSGKMKFTRENQTYVTVIEGTANLDYVTQAIQRK